MTYQLNPHRHVKIWISKRPHEFLNSENQARLHTMREANPNDLIHFLYAKQLLSKAALKKLKHFCKKHHITPVSIEDEILPQCVGDIDVMNLVTLYQHYMMVGIQQLPCW